MVCCIRARILQWLLLDLEWELEVTFAPWLVSYSPRLSCSQFTVSSLSISLILGNVNALNQPSFYLPCILAFPLLWWFISLSAITICCPQRWQNSTSAPFPFPLLSSPPHVLLNFKGFKLRPVASKYELNGQGIAVMNLLSKSIPVLYGEMLMLWYYSMTSVDHDHKIDVQQVLCH